MEDVKKENVPVAATKANAPGKVVAPTGKEHWVVSDELTVDEVSSN